MWIPIEIYPTDRADELLSLRGVNVVNDKAICTNSLWNYSHRQLTSASV